MTIRSDEDITEGFCKTFVEFMDQPMCIVDDDYNILPYNKEWGRFAEVSGVPSGICAVEENMGQLCDSIADGLADAAGHVVQGIRSVVEGKQESCEFNYCRHGISG
jgi:hypothetical protein